MEFKVEQKVITRLQTGMLACLVVYAAYLFAQFTWFSMETQGNEPIALGQVSSLVEEKVDGYAGKLAQFHLFGKAGMFAAQKVDTPIVAPKTRLRLILKGVFTAEQGGSSGAIVEEIGKTSDYYALGATLPGNAVLEEVYDDRVLLRRNGRLETLSFDDKEVKGQSIIAKAPRTVQKKYNGRVKSPEQFIEQATSQIAINPEKALTSVGLAPSAGGYVYQGGNPMLSGLNLQKGDVIRSVNGNPLGDIKKDKNLMKGLYEQGSLEVEVVRDGASFFINYPLR
ncbi:MAG: general secretion pathway protein C [Pseudohongiellaceae bacterium]